MKKIIYLLSLMISYYEISVAQQDTVIYDPVSGNYTFQYLWEDPNNGTKTDSLITFVFIPSTKINPSVFAKAILVSNGAGLLYNYRIASRSDSKQNLFGFDVQYGKDIDVENKSINKWHYGKNSGFQDESLNRILHWYGDQGLAPNWSTQGFIIESTGLPSIGISFFNGIAPIPKYYPNIPYKLAKTYDSLNSYPTNTVKRMTIIPGSFIVPFVPSIFLDTLTSYTTQSFSLGWITTQTIANKYLNYFSTAKTQLLANNNGGARTTLRQVLTDVNIDSSSTLTSEAYALLRFNTEYLISKLPAQTTPYLNIALKNSTGTKLSGGTLQYYDASWKDAVNNNDGTFNINTSKTSLSLRMTYAYCSQQKNNVPVNGDTVIFQTVNAQVQLRSSSGTLLDTGTVQYYVGAWRSFGTTSNGVATKELLEGSYTFRMAYGYASNDTMQDLTANPTVIFKTTNAQVQLKNSLGDLIDQGTVQYYAGAWRAFGTTLNGIAIKELLPNNYSFRMMHEYVSIDKTQNVGSDNTVTFSTVPATVQVKNSQNNPVNNAVVTYYSGAWRTFGTTVNGQTVKELLPANLQFRAKLGTAQADKTQNLSTNPLVEIQLP